MPVVLDRGEPMLTTPTTIGLTRATLLRLLAALAALALVAAACGGDDDGDGDTAVEDDGGDTADDASDDGSADNVQERQPTARRRATSGTRTNQAPDRRPNKGLPAFDLTIVTTFDDATGKGA